MRHMMRKILTVIWIFLQALPENSALQDYSSVGRASRALATCETVGRMPNYESESCSSYFLCAVNSDGTLAVAKAHCPTWTVFSLEKLQCVSATSYSCPSSSLKAAKSELSPAADESDPYPCEQVGRFANPASSDCKTYYLCTENKDGSLVPFLVNCPGATLFSSEVSTCVASPPGVCENSPPATTTEASTTAIVSTTGSTPFSCPGVGRFPDQDSTDCRTYYLCTLNANNVVVALRTSCPLSTIFSADELKCVSPGIYTCPMATTETAGTTTTSPTTSGDLTPTTSSIMTTIEPETTTEGTSSTTESETPSSEDWTTQTIVEQTTATSIISTTEDVTSETRTQSTDTSTKISTPSTSVETTASIASTQESTVSSTHMATEEPTDTTATTTVWPHTSSTAEQTNSGDPTAPPPSTTALPSTTTLYPISGPSTTGPVTSVSTTAITAPPEPFVCYAEGRYPDPNAIACETYMLCIVNSIGTLTAIKFSCPPTSIFSNAIAMCVSADFYSCGSESSQPGATSTIVLSTSPITEPEPKPFVCPSSGRFANPASIFCKSYYLCLYDAYDILYAIELSCPQATIFAESELKCVPAAQYTCVPPTGGTGATTTTTEMTTTSTTTEQIITECVAAGKFPAFQFIDCKSYIYCIRLATGDFLHNVFKCPGSTLFDEERLVCSDSYVCPR